MTKVESLYYPWIVLYPWTVNELKVHNHILGWGGGGVHNLAGTLADSTCPY